ncbi:MAG: DUF814 domain-containing protein [Candidatus Micrarchaeota archaeon]|nr:DUF814 domain-containing protein [Candidatus Micrarchaeota archaeon]
MELKIDYTKSAQQNAEEYFERSKRARRKAEGAEQAILDLERKRKEIEGKKRDEKRIRHVEEKKWYEKFNWFFASNGMLCIGGRSAQQNELINSKHFDDNDLFFHADIFGASVVILKDGVKASQGVREEAAQFAGIFSSAWEDGASTVNVYSLKRPQVSKSKEKGSLGTGSFLLEGEREWFKGMALELAVFMNETTIGLQARPVKFIPEVKIIPDAIGINFAPLKTCNELNISRYMLLRPGKVKKSDAAKLISKALRYPDLDYIMQHLPAGSFSAKEVR